MATPTDIPALVRRLRSASRVTQLQAINQLADIVLSGPAECEAVIAASGVPAIVQLVATSNRTAVQEAAVGLLGLLADDANFELGRQAIAAAGGIPALVTVLQHGTTTGQAAAASVLEWLALQCNDRKAAVVAAGAVKPLVQLLRSQQIELQEAATGALCYLADGSEACSAAIAAAGAIPALVRLIPVLHEEATWLLAHLAWDSQERLCDLFAAGPAAALERELLSGSEADQEAAATLFGMLVHAEPNSKVFAAASAATGTIVRCLGAGSEASRLKLLEALGRLAQNEPASCATMLAAGVVPALPPCLQPGGDEDVRGVAAELIRCMGYRMPAERETIGTAGITVGLIGLLRCDDDAAAQSAWALRNLALDCPANGQAILSAAGFTEVQQLLRRNTISPGKEELRGAAAVALCTLAQGSEQLRQAAEAAGAAAAVEQALPAWRAEKHAIGVVEAAQSALNFQANVGPSSIGGRQDAASARTTAACPPPMCAAPGCGATHGLHRCGGCGTVRYCSPACSKAHWRAHKGECRRLQAEKAAAAALKRQQAGGAADAPGDGSDS